MKTVVFLFLLLLPATAFSADMQKYLSVTQDLVAQERYPEALARFIWFHEHSLEHEPGMYGVRLSFALSYWKCLGEKYPPAHEAMVEMRDRKTGLLLSGKAKPALFHEIVALNRTLEEDYETVGLFERLDAERPQEVKDLWEMAKEPLFAAQRHDLIAKYMGSPITQFIKVKARYDLNTSLYEDERFTDRHFREFNEDNFVEESLRLIEISLQLGNTADALEIQERAAAVLDDPRLRAVPSEIRQ